MDRAIAAAANFRFGLAVVENAFDRTLAVAVGAGRHALLEEETRLNALAKPTSRGSRSGSWNILVVGQIGKEISGRRHGPDVTGRAFA